MKRETDTSEVVPDALAIPGSQAMVWTSKICTTSEGISRRRRPSGLDRQKIRNRTQYGNLFRMIV